MGQTIGDRGARLEQGCHERAAAGCLRTPLFRTAVIRERGKSARAGQAEPGPSRLEIAPREYRGMVRPPPGRGGRPRVELIAIRRHQAGVAWVYAPYDENQTHPCLSCSGLKGRSSATGPRPILPPSA